MINVTCWKYKEVFGLTNETHALLKRSGKAFCCPWGHEAVFVAGPTEADKLRQERDRLKQDAARLNDELAAARRRTENERDLRHGTERRLAAQKGVATRMKNRVAAGVCPCCNRSFENLRRHMSAKHAGFIAEGVQAEAGQTLQ